MRKLKHAVQELHRMFTMQYTLHDLWDAQADEYPFAIKTKTFFDAMYQIEEFFGVEYDTCEEYIDFAEKNGLLFDRNGRLRHINPVVTL